MMAEGGEKSWREEGGREKVSDGGLILLAALGAALITTCMHWGGFVLFTVTKLPEKEGAAYHQYIKGNPDTENAGHPRVGEYVSRTADSLVRDVTTPELQFLASLVSSTANAQARARKERPCNQRHDTIPPDVGESRTHSTLNLHA